MKNRLPNNRINSFNLATPPILARILNKLFPTPPANLINTPLQRGGRGTGELGNRFNGFSHSVETVKTVSTSCRSIITPLKRGVNGKDTAGSGALFGTCRLLAFALLLLPFTAHAKLNVVATTPDLGALAREIGGDKIELTTLARPTEDPHFVDAKPSFVVKLRRADVLIEGGAELELGWLPPLLENARNPKLEPGAPGRIAASQGIQLLEVPATLDRSKGDIHAAGNPHFIIDPANARIIAQHICDSFCQIDAKSCSTYQANLKKFTTALDLKLAAWQHLLAPFKGQHVVAYHNSWPYFGERFGLQIDLFLEPKPGIPPTPSHLAEVQAKMRELNVHVIIVDPYLNRRTAETVARNTGAAVLNVTQFPGGIKGTEGGYIALLDYLASSLAKALEAKLPAATTPGS